MENKEELMGKDIIIEDSTIEYIEPKQQFVRPPMSKWNQLILAFYWFSSNMVWQAQLGIAMPYQVRAAVGDEKKGTYFGLVTAIGAGLSLIAAPIFGALSDRIKLPGGKRKPWVVIGTVGNIFALIGMGYLIKPGEPDTIYLWALCYMIFIIFNNVAVAPYTALIPDLVPLNQRGSASGMMGLMTLLGNFAGGSMGFFVDSLGVANIYWIMIISLILGLLVVWFGVKELNLENHEPVPFRVGEFLRSLKDPFENNDFKWVFWTRMLVMLGNSLVGNFAQYYFGDVVRTFALPYIGTVAKTAERAVSFFIFTVLIGSLMTTTIAGHLSDKHGRKIIVFAAGSIMSAVCLTLIFTADFTTTVIMGWVFGLGAGAFLTVDWALVSDVLPSDSDYAKDMGVWHVADVLPQVLSGSVGGVLLDIGNDYKHNFGYTLLFIIAFVSYTLGSIFVYKIKGVK